MPQVTCPNCGLTISLENRKEVDFALIKGATAKKSATFTELLHTTKLSRKTLSLRLREMCINGAIVKNDGMYKLNGTSRLENNGKDFVKGVTRAFHLRRVNPAVLALMLLISFSVSGYVLAMYFAPSQPMTKIDNTPVILGSFTMALDANNVKDLYAWQSLIVYNSSQLEVLEIVPGGFVGAEYLTENTTDVSRGIFANSTLADEGKVLLGGTECGNVSGKDGDGRLATVVFGYFVDDYDRPTIAFTHSILLDSQQSRIPIEPTTLTLTAIEE